MKVAQSAGNQMRSVLGNGTASELEKSQAIVDGATALKRAYLINAFAEHFGTDQVIFFLLLLFVSDYSL